MKYKSLTLNDIEGSMFQAISGHISETVRCTA